MTTGLKQVAIAKGQHIWMAWYLKHWKGKKNLQPKVIYPVRLFRIERKINNFSDNKNQEFIDTTWKLQEM